MDGDNNGAPSDGDGNQQQARPLIALPRVVMPALGCTRRAYAIDRFSATNWLAVNGSLPDPPARPVERTARRAGAEHLVAEPGCRRLSRALADPADARGSPSGRRNDVERWCEHLTAGGPRVGERFSRARDGDIGVPRRHGRVIGHAGTGG
jgi:hypothetical protein